MDEIEIHDAIPSLSNWKPLGEYTNEELHAFLQGKETQCPQILAYICSEVLKRKLQNNYQLAETDD